ncbi:MAG: DUF1232 domain-containing protein [Chloroflexi bacterium]|nr:DUF1232 domain-containing protein [Chloroflexota bacterium]
MDALADPPWWAVTLAAAVLVYAAIVAVLILFGRRLLARELATLVPNLVRLFRGLLGDPRVPLRAKAVLLVGIVWIASPIDLIPEFVPIAGPLDDAIVAALVLAYVSRAVGRDVVREHWHGDPTTLARLLRLA